ncbi:MAG: Hsp20/alpha crystallin family protein [bacterium]|nr:Hsp20/alpha crystallin family protein [bacterium]
MTNLCVRPTRHWNMDRMFEDFFGTPARWEAGHSDFAPRTNIEENDNEIGLTFELPGMDKGDIKVSVVDGVLSISGERKFKKEDTDANSLRSEIRTGSFSRSFTLPDTVDSEKISADYKDGLLLVRMAKLEEVKPKEIEVKVS